MKKQHLNPKILPTLWVRILTASKWILEMQTEFVFQNIQKILQEAGASLDDIVKAVIYVTDISKFKDISVVRNKYSQTLNQSARS